jgi:hypothetical protein
VNIDKDIFFKPLPVLQSEKVNVAPAGPGKNLDTAPPGGPSTGPAPTGPALVATDHGSSNPAIRFPKHFFKHHFYADHHY